MEDSRAKNISEEVLIKQFRKRVSDVLKPVHTNAVLMKWLRAGNFNLKKCEQLLRESLAGRALYDIDNFADHGIIPEVLDKFGFVSPLGIAKDGTPICYCAMGRGDMYGIVASVSSYEICLYGSLCFERDLKRAREESKKTGKELNEVTYVVDMEGFNLKSVAQTCVIETAFDLFRLMQDIYPEVWKKLLVVNAAFYFYQAFNFLKPIFRNTFLQNISVVSKENTPDLLLKYIDADVLPVFLGGKLTDSNGDPMCREFIKFGSPVPDDYYLSRQPPLLPSDPGVESVYIGPKAVYNHPLIVNTLNSRLHIEIRSEGGSVLTTILFRKFGADPKHLDIPPRDVYLNENVERDNVRLISPSVKLQTHLSPVDVYCNLPWPDRTSKVLIYYINWKFTKNLQKFAK